MYDALKHIADKQLLEAPFKINIGILDGRMGISLFFFYCARYMNNRWYEIFAGELVDDICADLSANLPITFANGLCGIGWGIEWMKKQGFIEGDTDEILSEIDKKIMERDPRRITDYSFETGLQGIAAYIQCRLESVRDVNNADIFDTNYLYELEKACKNIKEQYSYSMESIWDKIIENFTNTRLSDDDNWKKGIQIINNKDNANLSEVVDLVYNQSQTQYEKELYISSRKCLFIISEMGIATQYGIGTYIRQLVQCFDPHVWDIHIVSTYSNRNAEVFKLADNIVRYDFPIPSDMLRLPMPLHKDKYQRSIFYYLASRLGIPKNIYCHFNLFGYHRLAMLFKEQLQAHILFTLHYTFWRFELEGNWQQFKKILTNPTNEHEKQIIQIFEEEKDFMSRYSDRVIAISRHSYNMLQKLYNIPKSKLVYIPNGLKECYNERNKYEKQELRKKYHFDLDEKLVIFAGRLDSAKGINELIMAFKQVINEIPNCKLIIAGDGNFIHSMRAANPYWNKLIFTGFISQEQLYELYAISQVGVVPSYYEEFGYVALEMIMNGLPVIVNNTTGLREIVNIQNYNLTFDYGKDKDISNLKDKLLSVLLEKDIDRTSLQSLRIWAINHYSIQLFQERIIKVYNSMESHTQV